MNDLHIRWMIRRDVPRVLEIENESFAVPPSSTSLPFSPHRLSLPLAPLIVSLPAPPFPKS